MAADLTIDLAFHYKQFQIGSNTLHSTTSYHEQRTVQSGKTSVNIAW